LWLFKGQNVENSYAGAQLAYKHGLLTNHVTPSAKTIQHYLGASVEEKQQGIL
jgi:hypothetical protein